MTPDQSRGKVEKHGAGIPVFGKITTLTFSGCSGGEVTSPVVKPGSLDLSFVNANEGKLTSTSAEVIIHNTLFGTCTFTTAITGTSLWTLTTTEKLSSTATLDIKARSPVPAGRAPGRFLCDGETGSVLP
jgi:hypothetical protein